MVRHTAYSLPALALAGLASSKIVHVRVGDGGQTYKPNEIKADIGDRVRFHFEGGVHDVVHGTFDNPCQMDGGGAFYSGRIEYADTKSMDLKARFTIPVNNKDPIWVYCSERDHCQKGMAAVINPPSNSKQTLKAYTDAAKDAPDSNHPMAIGGGALNLVPTNLDDDDINDGDNSSSSSSSSSSTSTSNTSTDSSSATRTRSPTGTETGSQTASETTGPPTVTDNAAVHVLGHQSAALNAIVGAVAVGAGWLGAL